MTISDKILRFSGLRVKDVVFRFSSAQNFQKLIADLGITGVYEAIVKGKQFHRVRIGPLKDVTQADNILTNLIKRGYPGARVVVKTS